MIAVDGAGVPLTFLTEGANISEFKLALKTIDQISVEGRPLHPKKRPGSIVADKGYDARWLRNAIRTRNITPYIPKRRKKGQKEEPSYKARIKPQ